MFLCYINNMDCIFCDIVKNKNNIIAENDLAVAFYDSFPVSDGHALVIPKRHVETYFDLNEAEIAAIFELSQEIKRVIDDKFHPTGYNVGFNVGRDGGQTVMHCHLHIIPRYLGDIENPRGGIRNIIKSKTKY